MIVRRKLYLLPMKPFWLLLLVFTIGCQSRLVPVAYQPKERDAHVGIATQDDITIYLENLEYKNEIVVFDLEIINESGEGFYFDPEKIYFYTSPSGFKSVENLEENWQEKSSSLGTAKYAMSKRGVENYYRKSIRSKETSKFLVGLLAVGATALNIAGGSGELGGSAFSNVAREVLVGASIVGSEVANDVLTQKQIQDDEDLYYVDQEILKNGNVEDGSAIRGKVYLKRRDRNKFYRVVVPLTYYDFIFDMREASGREMQYLR